MRGKCASCKDEIFLYKRFQNGKVNKDAFKVCITCYKKWKKNPESNLKEEAISETVAISSFISALDLSLESVDDQREKSTTSPVRILGNEVCTNSHVVLDHHIFTPAGWSKVSTLRHPTLRTRISTLKSDYDIMNVSYPIIAPKFIDVVADSGAQSCLHVL